MLDLGVLQTFNNVRPLRLFFLISSFYSYLVYFGVNSLIFVPI
jgi:hypothetical protein